MLSRGDKQLSPTKKAAVTEREKLQKTDRAKGSPLAGRKIETTRERNKTTYGEKRKQQT